MKKRLYILAVGFILLTNVVDAQDSIRLTLSGAISTAYDQSVDGLMAKYQYLSDYFQFKIHKAQLLPSITLGGTLPSFNRSLSSVQNAVTGEYNYVNNYMMENDLGLTIKQNIALTGGNVQLFTGISRMDQYSPRRTIDYRSAPINLIYNQPIGAFNSLRWDRKIEPKRYEQAKYTYLEAVQEIAIQVVDYFFDQLTCQREFEMAQLNHRNTDTLYRISLERFKIGAITKNDLLQLELRLLNQLSQINSSSLRLNLAKQRLRSYLGYADDVDIVLDIPSVITDINIPFDDTYALSMYNTSVLYRNTVRQLEAERDIAKAKADRRPQLNLSARFGLNQVAGTFGGAYVSPMDQEDVQLSLQIPIFDGGVSKGRLQLARSRAELVDAQIEKEDIDRKQDVYLKVMQFNNQNMQCMISQKADSVAQQRYELSMVQFALGRISVLDFNTAQSERGDAQSGYIAELRNFWSYYYNIQRLTLFDFVKGINISTSFDRTMLEK